MEEGAEVAVADETDGERQESKYRCCVRSFT